MDGWEGIIGLENTRGVEFCVRYWYGKLRMELILEFEKVLRGECCWLELEY